LRPLVSISDQQLGASRKLGKRLPSVPHHVAKVIPGMFPSVWGMKDSIAASAPDAYLLKAP
jgi:hypothetical protein